MERREFLIKTSIAAASVSLAGDAMASDVAAQHFSHERDYSAGLVLNLKIGNVAPKIIASITGMRQDGGGGLASITLPLGDVELLEPLNARTMSDPQSNPVTGADLGSGLVQGKDA